MGSAAAEFSLDLRLFTARAVAGFLNEALAMSSGEGRVAKLEESVRSLAEEQRKIEAFKRELPLCMHLLSDVIEGLEKELEQCRGERCTRVFGELISIKSKFEEERRVKLESDCKEKMMNWMSSAQLWSDNSGRNNGKDDKNEKKVRVEGGGELNHQQKKENLFLESKSLSGGGALPFKGLSAVAASSKEEENPTATLPDLSLQAPEIDNGALTFSGVTEGHGVSGSGSKGAGRTPVSAPAKAGDHHPGSQAPQQPPRKVRRCWSPELHRRFLFSLQQLGGIQAATPKQIRELMNVDGLANDEVKSHLQKYRLHVRRMPNSSDASTRPVAMGGGAWVPEEQYSNSSQQSVSQSGSPQSPLQLARSTRATAGDSGEEEDGKSESYSWK